MKMISSPSASSTTAALTWMVQVLSFYYIALSRTFTSSCTIICWRKTVRVRMQVVIRLGCRPRRTSTIIKVIGTMFVESTLIQHGFCHHILVVHLRRCRCRMPRREYGVRSFSSSPVLINKWGLVRNAGIPVLEATTMRSLCFVIRKFYFILSRFFIVHITGITTFGPFKQVNKDEMAPSR